MRLLRFQAAATALALAFCLTGCRIENTARITVGDILDATKGQSATAPGEMVVMAPISADKAQEQASQILDAIVRIIPGISYLRFEERQGSMENALIFELPFPIYEQSVAPTTRVPTAIIVTPQSAGSFELSILTNPDMIADARRALTAKNMMFKVEDRNFVFRIRLENDQRQPFRFIPAAVFVDGKPLSGDAVELPRRKEVLVELSNHSSQRLLVPGVGTVIFGRLSASPS
jgi:hypothetical protein